MNEKRPDPELLLRQITASENAKTRGKLKIFFGYAAGVGKTYAMLEAAQQAKKNGVDVVAGYVEPHQRPETSARSKGLEVLATKQIVYKDITLEEFDIDAAIKRHPQLILIDELAHTNAPGSRHVKRYQDIEELLKLGIDVYTTVNVQHLESLNDIVASITGVVVRERILDSFFDSADQVELVDIEPESLIERLHQGKIYRENQAQRALGNFFTEDNLIALREIALRRTADQVNKAVERSKQWSQHHDYFTGEHILICLSSAPNNQKVIRTAARIADAFHGEFTALFVETSDFASMSDLNRSRLRENIKLAEQLGAKIVALYGDDVPYQIAEYAKASGVSKIVTGRSPSRRFIFFHQANFTDHLIELAPNIDIYVIPNQPKDYKKEKKIQSQRLNFSLLDTGKSVGVLAIATLIGFWFYSLGFSESNIIIVYTLGVLIIAMLTTAPVYSLTSSLLAVFLFNFCFTEPRFSLETYDPGYPVTFIVMFVATFIISTITKRLKLQTKQESLKASRTEVLLETSQKLQRSINKQTILADTAEQVRKLLHRPVIVYPIENDSLANPIFAKQPDTSDLREYMTNDELAVANWVMKNNKHAGVTTNTLPGAKCLYLAIRSGDAIYAVAAIPIGKGEGLESFEKGLLIAILSECGMALEKNRAISEKNAIRLEAKQEQLRANLLRAISHDLRTPLTSISGNVDILLQNADVLSKQQQMDLYTNLYDDSHWLMNMVENLLSVTRIEDGKVQIELTEELVEDVINEALNRVNKHKAEHHIEVQVDDPILMAKMDPQLIVQVIMNIVDNAIKYTPTGSTIEICARKRMDDMVEIIISDDGEGIDDASKEKLFDMFFTVDSSSDSRRGLGLGLSLCKSIIMAQGGTITVGDHVPHGTQFTFTLRA